MRQKSSHKNSMKKNKNTNQKTLPVKNSATTPRKKHTGITRSSAIIAALFFVFVVVHMVQAAQNFLAPSTNTEVVRMDSTDAQQSVRGIIIRDEVVLYAPKDGRVEFLTQDHERVRPRTAVAHIRALGSISNIEQEIIDIEQEIIQINERRLTTEVDPQVTHFNNILHNLSVQHAHHFTTRNLSDIYTLHDNIMQVSTTRNQMIVNDARRVGGELGAAHEMLQHQYNQNIADVITVRSGIVSRIIDGYEHVFTLQNMHEITREQMRQTLSTDNIAPARDVNEGDPVVKIISNFWYVATYMPNHMVQDLSAGQERTVFLYNVNTNHYDGIIMTVDRIVSGDRDSFVVFRSTRHVTEFLNQRNVYVRLTENVHRGLRINNAAIATRRFIQIPRTHIHGAEHNVVQHRTADGLVQITLSISQETDDFVYVLEETLNLFLGATLEPINPAMDAFVITESALSIVQGVYRTNTGYADFRVLHLTGGLSDEGYTLIDPNLNRAIRLFDTIASDASMITQGQIVR